MVRTSVAGPSSIGGDAAEPHRNQPDVTLPVQPPSRPVAARRRSMLSGDLGRLPTRRGLRQEGQDPRARAGRPRWLQTTLLERWATLTLGHRLCIATAQASPVAGADSPMANPLQRRLEDEALRSVDEHHRPIRTAPCRRTPSRSTGRCAASAPARCGALRWRNRSGSFSPVPGPGRHPSDR